MARYYIDSTFPPNTVILEEGDVTMSLSRTSLTNDQNEPLYLKISTDHGSTPAEGSVSYISEREALAFLDEKFSVALAVIRNQMHHEAGSDPYEGLTPEEASQFTHNLAQAKDDHYFFKARSSYNEEPRKDTHDYNYAEIISLHQRTREALDGKKPDEKATPLYSGSKKFVAIDPETLSALPVANMTDTNHPTPGHLQGLPDAREVQTGDLPPMG